MGRHNLGSKLIRNLPLDHDFEVYNYHQAILRMNGVISSLLILEWELPGEHMFQDLFLYKS